MSIPIAEQHSLPSRLADRLERINRRAIYLFVAVSLSLPIIADVQMKPAPMATARALYEAVNALNPEDGKIVLIAADWGPGTMAENRPQTALAIEHLMRKRQPFALISIYTLAVPFLEEVPNTIKRRLEVEMPGQTWEYGRDWVNLGYRPGGIIMIQRLAKAENLHEALKTDANETPIAQIPMMRSVKTAKDISMLMQFTGLVGVFNYWLQFFPGPTFVHGCTSITIPEAFIYYSSKQIVGFFEGLAGAAYYETILDEAYPGRSGESLALATNTGLAFAQLVVLGFIVLGNAGVLLRKVMRS
ncbi:MAG: hypothetical protein KDD69_09960 [Bdellovibrionales bacterium]|nr:hypothetical protein [Bdellovibrionales bacterium]